MEQESPQKWICVGDVLQLFDAKDMKNNQDTWKYSKNSVDK